MLNLVGVSDAAATTVPLFTTMRQGDAGARKSAGRMSASPLNHR